MYIFCCSVDGGAASNEIPFIIYSPIVHLSIRIIPKYWAFDWIARTRVHECVLFHWKDGKNEFRCWFNVDTTPTAQFSRNHCTRLIHEIPTKRDFACASQLWYFRWFCRATKLGFDCLHLIAQNDGIISASIGETTENSEGRVKNSRESPNVFVFASHLWWCWFWLHSDYAWTQLFIDWGQSMGYSWGF